MTTKTTEKYYNIRTIWPKKPVKLYSIAIAEAIQWEDIGRASLHMELSDLSTAGKTDRAVMDWEHESGGSYWGDHYQVSVKININKSLFEVWLVPVF